MSWMRQGCRAGEHSLQNVRHRNLNRQNVTNSKARTHCFQISGIAREARCYAAGASTSALEMERFRSAHLAYRRSIRDACTATFEGRPVIEDGVNNGRVHSICRERSQRATATASEALAGTG